MKLRDHNARQLVELQHLGSKLSLLMGEPLFILLADEEWLVRPN